jgi:hypothetical protein
LAPELSKLIPRVLKVLLDLQRISEAAAAQADEDRAGGVAAHSQPPPGFDLETGAVHRDEESLLDQHLRALERWCVRAEDDRDRRKFKSPDYRERYSERGTETDEAFAKRIQGQHRGKLDLAVALEEGCDEKHVRHARASLGLDVYGNETAKSHSR